MTDTLIPTAIPDSLRGSLRLLYVAKHARWTGGLHGEDGNHAVYHREMREILEGLDLKLTLGDRYEDMFTRPDVDFVFPMLNRGGFFNSEMLLPLLCNRHGLKYVGASPILRGLSDDKHLSKLEAVHRGVPTAPWAVYRRGAPIDAALAPCAARWVVKPNNSSASWGIGDAHDFDELINAVAAIHAQGHDAIVEPFLEGSDVEVPVILSGGRPVILPMMMFEQRDPSHLRTYAEKRDLVDRGDKYRLVRFDDSDMAPRIAAMTRALIAIFHPFDFGRFEFRVNLATGDIQFLEVNLNCNLWSEKVFGHAARAAGFTQAQLIETILAESLLRQGLGASSALAYAA